MNDFVGVLHMKSEKSDKDFELTLLSEEEVYPDGKRKLNVLNQ